MTDESPEISQSIQAMQDIAARTTALIAGFESVGKMRKDDDEGERRKAAVAAFLAHVQEVGFDPKNPIVENTVAVILHDYADPAVQLSSAKARVFDYMRNETHVAEELANLRAHRAVLNACELRKTDALDLVAQQNERAIAAAERQAAAFEAIAKALAK